MLSGGKAYRFQNSQQDWQDKALVLLEDKPLLVHVIKNITDVVDEVIVCVNNDERKTKYLEVLEKHNLRVKIVVDEKTVIGGPNVAILSGLKATQTDFCITIPCDMPFVKPKVVDYLFNISEGFDVVIPMWPNGTIETLIMVLQHTIGMEIVQTLCQLKRPRPSDIPRAAPRTLLASPLKTIKTLDPNLKSFININTQEELRKPQTRNTQGPIQQNVELNQEDFQVSDLQLMYNAAKRYQENKFIMTYEKFNLCKKHFEDRNNFFWAALANENKGKTLLKQTQLQKETKPQTTLEFEFKYKEAFSNAVLNYHKEAKLYEKHFCLRLLERTIADKDHIKTRFAI